MVAVVSAPETEQFMCAVIMDDATVCFLSHIGRQILECFGDKLNVLFLFQQISVLIHFNLILFHETFPAEDGIKTEPLQPAFFPVFNPWDLYY